MINLSGLVLGPAMAAFAQPFILTPVASQGPTAAPYAARGSYSTKPVQIPVEGDQVHSTVQPMLGIRVAEFPVAPKQDDLVTFLTVVQVPNEDPAFNFVIVDYVPDGQGGADLWIRRTDAPEMST